MAGAEHLAGVEYNDESHDREVCSGRDLSDGGRDIHGSEVEDIAFTREVRAVRRKKTQRQVKVGRIRHANRFQPLAEYVPDIIVVYRAARAPFGKSRRLARVQSETRMRARLAWHSGPLFHGV